MNYNTNLDRWEYHKTDMHDNEGKPWEYQFNMEEDLSDEFLYIHHRDEFEEEPVQIGDLNGDGNIDSLDYIILRRCVLGQLDMDSTLHAVADLNEDNKVDSLDYILLRRYILGDDVVNNGIEIALILGLSKELTMSV